MHDIGAAVEPVYHLVEEADGDSDYGSDYDTSNGDEVFNGIAKYWLLKYCQILKTY